MLKIIWVGMGGFIGSILRYAFSGCIQELTKSVVFPHGTLAVNLVGGFAIGFLSQLAEGRGLFTAETRAFVLMGILGGFTTFSAFANETLNLLRDGENNLALLNIGVQVIAGLAVVWLGRTLAFLMWR